ncbi:hypothetical protein [Xanthomonas campestris]|uniref:hypothetical protein n=1 Tax=Xanthomonas campestris TaxID=339 RepID=UPI0011D18D6E|nr:hypothetical protein [Xanthomonas campestris]MEA9776424.1 hypothetical protein [Xanthomonas campestris pv. raphani]MEA9918932.1 hypothetical protein [Xanthomonas campestris pv. raphani]
MKTVHEMEARFASFAMTIEGAESIDKILQSTHQGQRADYLWRDRSSIVELKVLRADPQIKVDSTFDELRKRDDFPLIFGEVEASKVLAHLPDGDEQMRRLHQKVMRSVEGAFRDAKRQIANTKRILKLEDALGILVLLNPDIESLDPVNVGKEISRLIQKRQNDMWAVDVVWLLSEAHLIGGGMPCIIIEGDKVGRFPWSEDFIANLNKAWANFNGSPMLSHDSTLLSDLRVMRQSDNHVGPMTREQLWRENYRANPYLAQLDDNAVREFGHQSAMSLVPYFTKDGPRRPLVELEPLIQRWAHFLEEASMRGLNMRGMGLK